MITIENISSRVVKLNVGGGLFSPTESTLSESIYFMKLLKGSIESIKDENGCFFIDRNPNKFEWILEYLRHKKTFNFAGLSALERAAFMVEADFYQLRITNTYDSSKNYIYFI